MLACDECRVVFGDWARQQIDRLDGISESVAERIAQRALSKLWKRTFAVLTLITLVFGGSILGSIRYARSYIEDEIAARFAEEEVARVVEEAARDRAAAILADRVEPAVQELKETIKREKESLAADVAAVREEYGESLDQLRRQAEFFEKLAKIQELEDRAKLGDWEAFVELDPMRFPNTRLQNRVRVARLGARLFYVGTKSHAGFKISTRRADGSDVEEGDIETRDLIRFLLQHEEWKGRARAAELLRGRRHKGVPEALLTAMNKDPNTWVRVQALNAYSTITGFDRTDVFDFEAAQTWHYQNTEAVEKRLVPDPKAATGDRGT